MRSNSSSSPPKYCLIAARYILTWLTPGCIPSMLVLGAILPCWWTTSHGLPQIYFRCFYSPLLNFPSLSREIAADVWRDWELRNAEKKHMSRHISFQLSAEQFPDLFIYLNQGHVRNADGWFLAPRHHPTVETGPPLRGLRRMRRMLLRLAPVVAPHQVGKLMHRIDAAVISSLGMGRYQ